MGHRQTVQNRIRHRNMIRIFTGCLQDVVLKFECNCKGGFVSQLVKKSGRIAQPLSSNWIRPIDKGGKGH